MKTPKEKKYAVITGDIVRSSLLSPQDRRKLLKVIEAGSRQIRRMLGDAVPMDIDVFRGDSWQMLVTDPAQALRAALLFRAHLRWQMESHHFDTRLAIGVGTADLFPRRRVSEGSGEAFRLSGLALDGMKKRRMCFSSPGSDLERPLDVIVHLLDEIAVRWTDKQAHAVIGAMQGWTQEKIAGSWGDSPITQQTAAQHLEGAGWYAVGRGLGEFEWQLTRSLDTRPAPA
jgi:hypothetical protein